MTINTRLERARLIKRPNKANVLVLSAKSAEFQLLLTNKFEALNSAPSDDIDTYCDSITSSITEAALNTAGKDKTRRPDKLSLELREKRRQMKRNGTDVQHIEYTEICKAIKSRMSARGHQQLQWWAADKISGWQQRYKDHQKEVSWQK